MTKIDNTSASQEEIENVEERDEQYISKKDIKRNMICIVMLDAIFSTGWADISIALQPLLVYLGASNKMIGLITGANWAGLLGVFLSPWITRRFRYKKWYMFVVHIPYLLPLGLVGLGIVLSQSLGMDKSSMLTFMLVMFLTHWFFAGFVSLPHQEYTAACIPMSHRGRYSGFSFSIGGAVSIISAAIGGIIIVNVSKPVAYGYLFIMAWFIIQSGYISALFAKERPTPVEKSPVPWSRKMIAAAWNDKPFLRFLAINFLATIIFIPLFITYINIYGFKVLKMEPVNSSYIQIITNVVRIGLSFLIGIHIDKIGAKKVMPYLMLVAALALLPPILFHSKWAIFASVAISTFYIAGITACFTALIYGLPKPEDRAGHFTAQLILIYIANSLGPLLIGSLCDVMPYITVFSIFFVVALVMFPVSKILVSSLSDDVKSYS